MKRWKTNWQFVLLSLFFLFVVGFQMVQNIWFSQHSSVLLSAFPKVFSIHFLWPLVLFAIVLLLPRKLSWFVPVLLFSAGFWSARDDAFLSLPDWLKTLFILVSMSILLVGGSWRRFTWFSYAGPMFFFLGVLCTSLLAWKAFFSLTLLLASCAGLGESARKFVEGKRDDFKVEDISINIALGASLLSLSGFGLALLGLARPHIIVGLVTLSGLGSNKSWRHQLTSLRSSLTRVRLEKAWGFCVLGFATTLLGLFFLASLGPEMGNDALGGRVALAKRVLATGKLVPDPTLANFTLGWAGGELFYVWFYPFVGTSVARLWAWGLLGLMLVWALLSESSPFLALVGWLTVAASTHIWWQVFAGFVDLQQAFFALAAIVIWRRFCEQRQLPALALAFFLAGSATTVKMNGITLVLALALASVVCALKEKGKRIIILTRSFGFAALGFLLAVGPWALRSFFLTGNPTFPFFNGFWQSPFAPPKPMGPFFEVGKGALDWLLVIWNLFFSPEKFSNLGIFNPMLLFLLVMLLWLSRWERQSRVFLWASAVWFFVWLVTEPNSRYLLPAATMLMGALWLVPRERVEKVLGSYAVVVLAIFLGFLAQITGGLFWPARGVNGRTWPLSFILGRQDEAAYLQSLPTYVPCQHLNARYGNRYAVWQVNVRDALYCEGTVYDSWHGAYTSTSFLRGLLKAESSAPEELSRLLRERGITHLMHRSDNRYLDRWLMKAADAFISRAQACCLVAEFAHGGVQVFRLVEAGKKEGEWVPCQEKAPQLLGTVGRTAKVMVYKKFAGGELVRWQVGGQLVGSGLEAALAVWDQNDTLRLYQKQFWGLKPEGSILEVWQTLPQEVGRLQLALAGDTGDVTFVRCEIWQPNGVGALEGEKSQ